MPRINHWQCPKCWRMYGEDGTCRICDATEPAEPAGDLGSFLLGLAAGFLLGMFLTMMAITRW